MRKASRRPRWAGGRISPSAAGGTRPRFWAEQPDLPGTHGHQNVGALLGAERSDHRHGRSPRRGVHHLGPSDGLAGSAAGVSADGALCVLSLRLRGQFAARDGDGGSTCKRDSASSATRSRRAATSWACCSWAMISRRGGPAACSTSTRAVGWCPARTPRRCKWPPRSSGRCSG